MRILILLFLISTICQAKNYTIRGSVKDAESGEEIIGAVIAVKGTDKGVISNNYGYYSLSLEENIYTIEVSFVGYNVFEQKITLNEDKNIDFKLSPRSEQLKEVEISAQAKNKNVINPQMSVERLPAETVKKLPALLGEVDVVKTIQLLPGVQSTAEGASGFSVRGGSPDQNLILLDDAIVYNASHMAGFFSVFNNDAIKDVQLYKGDIPAKYGGRLSSLLDVRMKDGNVNKIEGAGGIGTISSRLTLDGPIYKDKVTFLASGRRTYADLMLLFSNDSSLEDTEFNFYDLNGKIKWDINENNRIYISAYNGKDVFGTDIFSFGFGNTTTTLRWNHFYNNKLFGNYIVSYSKYNYSLRSDMEQFASYDWNYWMKDLNMRYDLTYFLNSSNNIQFGLSSVYHVFNQGEVIPNESSSYINELSLPIAKSFEHGIYAQNEQKIGSSIILKYGLRLNIFQNYGPDTQYEYTYNFDSTDYKITDSTDYGEGEFYNTEIVPEPRIGVNYIINQRNSIKASYSRMAQFMHLAMNTSTGTPVDIWFTSSPNIKPQIANQFAVGYFRNFFNNRFESSFEVFYKKIDNAIDFANYAELFFNEHLDADIRTGTGRSYGFEFMFKKPVGKFNGWLSYTYSNSTRKINGVNYNKRYLSPYDRPHDISLVFNYDLTKKLNIGVSWVYATGMPATFPVGQYIYGNSVVPVYSERNTERFPDYHRMDVAATYSFNKNKKKGIRSELNVSVYNVYDRHNAWMIYFEEVYPGSNQMQAKKFYLFSIIPSLTYNFYF